MSELLEIMLKIIVISLGASVTLGVCVPICIGIMCKIVDRFDIKL